MQKDQLMRLLLKTSSFESSPITEQEISGEHGPVQVLIFYHIVPL